MQLYDNAFSPFARKVRMVLDHKRLVYDTIDGLKKVNRAALETVNRRVEVPTLVDGDITVVNSADIVAYLDYRYPDRPVYPSDPKRRVQARAWERCADTLVDAILIDISYWAWANRSDTMPAGLLDAARRDMQEIYDALERDLRGREFLCDQLSVADIALFPHLMAGKTLGVPFDKQRHPNVSTWLKRMSASEIGSADLSRTRAHLDGASRNEIELDRIFWRGDRIEWMLARGFHQWFIGEIEANRVIWPGLAIPGPMG